LIMYEMINMDEYENACDFAKVIGLTFKGPAVEIEVNESGFHINVVGDVAAFLSDPTMTTDGSSVGDLNIEFLHQLLDDMFIKKKINWDGPEDKRMYDA